MSLLSAVAMLVAAFLLCWALLWKTGLSKVPLFRDLVGRPGAKDGLKRRLNVAASERKRSDKPQEKSE